MTQKIVRKYGNTMLTIIPEISVELFSRVNAFDVRVICEPSFYDKQELMNKVCRILSKHSDVEIKTSYVAHDAHYDSMFYVEEITFQVTTPLEE